MNDIIRLGVTAVIGAGLSLLALLVIFRGRKMESIPLSIRFGTILIGLGVASTVVYYLGSREIQGEQFVYDRFLSSGAALVVKYEPNPVLIGGTLTLLDHRGGERKVAIGTAELRTQFVSAQRDSFIRPGAKRAEIRMWYWDTHPADGRMVVIRPS